MDKKAKYHIGQTVVATVTKWGSFGHSLCRVGETMTIDSVERRPDGNYAYICSMDGNYLTEDEIMSTKEYKALVA